MSHSLKVGPTIPIFRSQNLVILEICDFLQGRVREVGGERGGGVGVAVLGASGKIGAAVPTAVRC